MKTIKTKSKISLSVLAGVILFSVGCATTTSKTPTEGGFAEAPSKTTRPHKAKTLLTSDEDKKRNKTNKHSNPEVEYQMFRGGAR